MKIWEMIPQPFVNKKNMVVILSCIYLLCLLTFSDLAYCEESKNDFPERIVVFPIHAEEILFELIPQERIVYVGHPYIEEAIKYFPTMEKTENLPGANWQNCNEELILSLNPDLVVIQASLKEDYRDIFPLLWDQNIPVVFVPSPKCIEDIIQTIHILGDVVGEPDMASQIATDLQATLNTLSPIVSQIPDERRLSALYLGPSQQWFPVIAAASGIVNADNPLDDNEIDDDEIDIKEANPDIILICPYYLDTDGSLYRADDHYIEEQISALLNDPSLSSVNAIQNQNVYPFCLYESHFVTKSIAELFNLAYGHIVLE